MARRKVELEEARKELHKVLDDCLNLGMSVAVISRYPKGGWGAAWYGDLRGLYGTILKIYRNGFKNERRKARAYKGLTD